MQSSAKHGIEQQGKSIDTFPQVKYSLQNNNNIISKAFLCIKQCLDSLFNKNVFVICNLVTNALNIERCKILFFFFYLFTLFICLFFYLYLSKIETKCNVLKRTREKQQKTNGNDIKIGCIIMDIIIFFLFSHFKFSAFFVSLSNNRTKKN